MKKIKVLISFALIILCFPLMNVRASSNELDDYVFGGEYILSNEELETTSKKALENAMAKSPQSRMDEIIESWEYVGQGISNASPMGLVFNQVPGGYRYGSGGGGMYWGTSSATSGTISVGVTIGGKYASVSVAYAPGTKMTSSGQWKGCPESLWYDYVKLCTTTKYTVRKYDIYRKNKYDSGKGAYVRSEYIKTPYSYAFYWKKV